MGRRLPYEAFYEKDGLHCEGALKAHGGIGSVRWGIHSDDADEEGNIVGEYVSSLEAERKIGLNKSTIFDYFFKKNYYNCFFS